MDTRKRWIWSLVGVAALGLGTGGLVGCDGEAENTGEAIGERLDRAGDKIEDAADKTRDNLEDTAEKVGDKIEDAADEVEDKLD
jgi:hypothetical protein